LGRLLERQLTMAFTRVDDILNTCKETFGMSSSGLLDGDDNELTEKALESTEDAEVSQGGVPMEVGSDEGSDTSSSSSSSESEDGDEGGRGMKRRERFGWPRFVKFARPGVGSRTLLDQTLREEVVRVRDRFTKY
ncbi:hypothetical protein FOZ63_009504, partial [Perkinsus olseni]